VPVILVSSHESTLVRRRGEILRSDLKAMDTSLIPDQMADALARDGVAVVRAYSIRKLAGWHCDHGALDPPAWAARRWGYRRCVQMNRAGPAAASAGLLVLAALHAAWGAGSAWPMADRQELAEAVVGAQQVPSPAACYAVSAALASAAMLVAGLPRRRPVLRRIGVAGVAGVLAGRGALGLAGRTYLVSPGSTSARFTRLDRRVYSPACLALAGLSALAALPRRRAEPGT
jgi:hypothetical protein